jgi:hypothetical protein
VRAATDIAAAMKAVTSALAGDAITPGEAATIAAVVDTFGHATRSAPCPDLVRASTSRQPRWLARQKAWVAGSSPATGSKVPWPSRSGSHDKTRGWADISTGRRDLLQVRCRCSDRRLPIQFTIVVSGTGVLVLRFVSSTLFSVSYRPTGPAF